MTGNIPKTRCGNVVTLATILSGFWSSRVAVVIGFLTFVSLKKLQLWGGFSPVKAGPMFGHAGQFTPDADKK